MDPVRVGIIDVGANTLRLLVATPDGRSVLKVEEDRRQLGLGEDVEQYGYVSAMKVALAVEAARDQARRARKLGCSRVEIAITSPGRQSANGEDFASALGRAAAVPARILSADEEASLAWEGAVSALERPPKTIAVCDVGGGSTQIVVGSRSGGPAWSKSIDLGSLRLTQRILDTEQPGADAVARACEEVARAFDPVTPPLPRLVLGTGGTARALCRVLGNPLDNRKLEDAIELLAGSSHARIGKEFRVDKARSRTLLAGTIIFRELQGRLGLPLAQASGGVREGLALELFRESVLALA